MHFRGYSTLEKVLSSWDSVLSFCVSVLLQLGIAQPYLQPQLMPRSHNSYPQPQLTRNFHLQLALSSNRGYQFQLTPCLEYTEKMYHTLAPWQCHLLVNSQTWRYSPSRLDHLTIIYLHNLHNNPAPQVTAPS